MPSDESVSVFIPLARGRAATRAILWAVPALLLGAATFVAYGRLQFAPNAVSNHIVDYAIAVAAMPLPVLGLVCAMRAIRQLLAVIWFFSLGVCAGAGSLDLRLGPFGNASYPVKELDVRYPFELSGDSEDGGFEQFLPEEEQRERLLPRINHAQAKVPINRTILRFVAGDETQVAAMMRPAIERWRRANTDVREG